MMKTTHKIAFITGAGSRLGNHIAWHMLDRGYSLLLHYFTQEQGVEEVSRVAEKRGIPATVMQGDFSNQEGIALFLQRLADSGIEPDVLINAAGIIAPSRMGDVTLPMFEQLCSINATAPIMITNQLAAKTSKKMSCIHIGDVGADLLWPRFGGYCLSKKMLAESARYQAEQFAPLVRVNNIALGMMLRSEWMDDALTQTLIQKVPLGRSGNLDDIMSTIDFLNENDYITGQTITIDGGRSLKG